MEILAEVLEITKKRGKVQHRGQGTKDTNARALALKDAGKLGE